MTSDRRLRESDRLASPALDGITDPDAFRKAIERHIAKRRADPEFQARLQRICKEDRRASDCQPERHDDRTTYTVRAWRLPEESQGPGEELGTLTTQHRATALDQIAEWAAQLATDRKPSPTPADLLPEAAKALALLNLRNENQFLSLHDGLVFVATGTSKEVEDSRA